MGLKAVFTIDHSGDSALRIIGCGLGRVFLCHDRDASTLSDPQGKVKARDSTADHEENQIRKVGPSGAGSSSLRPRGHGGGEWTVRVGGS